MEQISRGVSMKRTIYIAEEYVSSKKDNIVHFVRLADNVFFNRHDLEDLVGQNLYCETRYMSYRTSLDERELPTTTDVISLDKLPFLAWYTNSCAIYEIYSFFSETSYPQLRLSKIKGVLLKIYLAVFGKD